MKFEIINSSKYAVKKSGYCLDDGGEGKPNLYVNENADIFLDGFFSLESVQLCKSEDDILYAVSFDTCGNPIIWCTVRSMTVKEARMDAGLSQAKMSKLMEIPKRTIEDWDSEKSSCPTWARNLIVEKLMRITYGE